MFIYLNVNDFAYNKVAILIWFNVSNASDSAEIQGQKPKDNSSKITLLHLAAKTSGF